MEEKWVNKFLDEKYQASFFSRLLAIFYDLITLAVVLIISGILMTWWMFHQSNAPDTSNLFYIREYIWEHEFHLFVINWIVLGIVAIVVQYIIPMFSKQTVGMKMVGLYLRDENANEISKSQYAKREMLKVFLFPTIFFSFKKGKRPLYDQYSKTFLLY
ncbi:hypothetical protein DS745_06790 [Anaerobacillus alkaliphilus]|uniref:RDD domain-containing protein n=1 Tax=Anaerobacillus alkaliphilus TaxID=1548597 RepID=A0A4Q0VVJ5_9BACI|nr:RDD family protein [Anaerobacillus alkaliphilus]RXJ02405.1 hypothetical protein DS745_06790 [Anaerobacillus alkaliphilus]